MVIVFPIHTRPLVYDLQKIQPFHIADDLRIQKRIHRMVNADQAVICFCGIDHFLKKFRGKFLLHRIADMLDILFDIFRREGQNRRIKADLLEIMRIPGIDIKFYRPAGGCVTRNILCNAVLITGEHQKIFLVQMGVIEKYIVVCQRQNLVAVRFIVIPHFLRCVFTIRKNRVAV